MNAINFIQQHGVDKAREVVSGAPEGATHIRDSYGFIAYLKDGERKEWYYENTWVMALSWHPDCLLPDLKRLVESVDLINSQYDGLKNAKELLRISPKLTEELRFLGQAIADYESIYGGEHV